MGTALTLAVAAAGGILWLRYWGAPNRYLLGETSIHLGSSFMDPRVTKSYSTEVRDHPGERMSLFCKNGVLVDRPAQDLVTMDQVVRKGLESSNDGRLFGSRSASTTSSPYTWINYSDFLRRAKYIGSAYLRLGLKPGAKNFVAIYSINRLEWVLAEHATYMYSLILVALYDTLGPEACNHILLQTEAKVVVCDTLKRARIIVDNCVEHHNPHLETIVVVEDFEIGNNRADKEALERDMATSSHPIKLLAWKDFEADGREHPQDPVPPKPDDLCSVCYTSGTTGKPKGVMLTHKNMLAMAAGLQYHFNGMLNNDTVTISFLPLAHMLERVVQMNVMIHGGRIGFYSGHVKNLSQDMKILKPTLFPTVPRLLNKMHDKVKESLSKSWIKNAIFRVALRAKEEEVKRGVIRSNGLWDGIFRPIREELGGSVKFIAVGSAPLSPEIMSFCRCVLGCLILEGYGQTECGGVCTLQIPGDPSCGSVGPPLACNLVKLHDVPDMRYFVKDGQGEICIKGPNVTQGYYKEKEATAQTIDSMGWLHSGDIGKWLPNGTLSIIDRKKHIFKLAQGEFVAPERIESVYCNSPFVSQVFVYGESIKSCLIAIVVPQEQSILAWAGNQPELQDLVRHHDWINLCRNAAVKMMIMQDMVATGKKGGLQSFEQVKDIYLTPELFTVENNLLTPTMKAKRLSLSRVFKPQLSNMYKELH